MKNRPSNFLPSVMLNLVWVVFFALCVGVVPEKALIQRNQIAFDRKNAENQPPLERQNKPKEQTIPLLPYTSLTKFITDLKATIPQSGSEAFIKPSASDRQTFFQAVLELLKGNTESASNLASSVNYDLAQLNEQERGKMYLVLMERKTNFRGLGTYLVDGSFDRNLILEVPHPFFDTNTLEEGTQILQETGARGLFVTGTHRCANREITPCTGTTTACNNGVEGPYRISDAGHFTENFFQEAHRATLSLNSPPVAISLHGNSDADLPDITLSDGTSETAPNTALVNKLRKILKIRGASVGSCNSEADHRLTLCGSSNVQGRLSNHSSSPCSTSASKGAGLFLHIEQHLNIRRNPAVLIGVLQKVIPKVR